MEFDGCNIKGLSLQNHTAPVIRDETVANAPQSSRVAAFEITPAYLHFAAAVVQGQHELHPHDAMVDLGNAFAAFAAPDAAGLKQLGDL